MFMSWIHLVNPNKYVDYVGTTVKHVKTLVKISEHPKKAQSP